MAEEQIAQKEDGIFGLSNNTIDLIMLATAVVLVFITSYFFNIFTFLVILFQKDPSALNFIDEVIATLLTLCIGLAVISWRRLRELKKETAERMRLQAQILEDYETKLETEKIICRGLHYDIEQYRKIERDVLERRRKGKMPVQEEAKDSDINN